MNRLKQPIGEGRAFFRDLSIRKGDVICLHKGRGDAAASHAIRARVAGTAE